MKKINFFLILLAFLGFCSEKKPEQKEAEESPISEKSSSDSLILGIDVSHFQGDIDWEKIKEANIRFAYDKATQGVHYLDPDYNQNKVGAHQAGLLHGSYHFFVSNASGVEQAEHFCQAIEYSEKDMPPVLDLEQGSLVGNEPIDKVQFQKEVLDWLKTVETKLGITPIIYTNHPFGDTYLDDPAFESYPLWIAEYGVSSPKIPKAWATEGWLIWQRSERGSIEGAIGNVDHDLFNPQKPFHWGK
ncbi:glycoside hydrolase family 25 protein [Algoriphagus confluentis]|uniref:Lysozyme n=1 Tax=Algoriphagus confluentis TaxID=1697556 RepID=A0ABQ6PNP3_9BACT|nr:hypothetical protein Aconfl_22280 [Algoriphagus confluentis]